MMTMEMFRLIRSAINGEKLSDRDLESLSSEQLSYMMKLSRWHDVDHLFAWGLKQNGITSEMDAVIEKRILMAIYRQERMKFDYDNLCDALEKAQIPFMPLKGSVLRKYYPEAWMRTSCDIDILVHAEDAKRAMSVLVEHGYTYQDQSAHDISLRSPYEGNVELHYDLIEEGRVRQSSEVLASVWDTATVREGFSHWYEMTDEMFYFYHIAHMAKHVLEGGCGIRAFVDLWIMDRIQNISTDRRNQLLERGGLLRFADVARKLSRVWFEDEAHDSASQQMEDYVLRGGVYGSDENCIMVKQQRTGGRLRYVMSKIFLSYDVIKYHYPILQTHRWLTPIMQVRRWFKLIFCGHLKRVSRELHYSSSITSAESADTQNFLNNMGL